MAGGPSSNAGEHICLAADRRNGRLQLKSASSPFPSVHGADLEGQQRVEFTRSPRHQGTPAVCAQRPAGIDINALNVIGAAFAVPASSSPMSRE
jgi:hypothetical protein